MLDSPSLWIAGYMPASPEGSYSGKADVRTYAHADYGHLERRLVSAPPATVQPLVMTESLFSMDGTELDVSRMAELRSKYGFS